MKKVYIVSTSPGISGAERRFFEIWYNLQKNYPIYIIINKIGLTELISHLKLDKSIHANKKLILFETKNKSLISQLIAIYKIYKKIDKNSIIHFPLIYLPFLSKLRSSKFIVSWVAPYTPINFKVLKFKLIIMIFFSFFNSFKIDVLNPSNYFFLSKKNIFRKKLSLTKWGSFSNSNIYKPNKKIPQIIFSGRLVPEKGILEFVKSIIFLKKLIAKNKMKMPNIVILGRGFLYDKIRKLIEKEDYKDINVKIFYTNETWKYLSVSKIFVSLQKYSNYPSQSLIEAMLCGCIPIITDNVDTKKIISKELSVLINNKINYEQLSEAIIKILQYSDDQFYELSDKYRKFAMSEFNNLNQINYFKNLYWNESYVNKN